VIDSSTGYPNPLIPGFNPDPSVVTVGGDYFLVTSSFEYLPAIPVYHSRDFVQWTQIGNISSSAQDLGLGHVPTSGGVWAPTIRHREGTFYVIVTIAMGIGCVLFTAEDPAGPWSAPLPMPAVDGIDPDLAWDDDGVALVTYSALTTDGPTAGSHHGIRQVRVDLTTGLGLDGPHDLWAGTGLMFPEAPHLYRRGDWWYLLLAEGGTERGHAVSIARSRRPDGGFEGYAGNPFLSARSTSRPIQCTGHGDLVQTPDGGTAMVLLGVRPRGTTRAFSALGRETFVTTVRWVDDWPVAEPVELRPRSGPTQYRIDFADPGSPGLDHGWLAVRRDTGSVASLTRRPGWLVIEADGSTLDDPRPCFLGRRQLNQTADVSALVDASAGSGGLAVRYDEEHHYSIETRVVDGQNLVTARARLARLEQTWQASLPGGPVELHVDAVPGPRGYNIPGAMTSDLVRLRAVAGDGSSHTLAELDGRYLSAETAASFTGRVVGLFASAGSVSFGSYVYRGSED